MFIKIGYSKCKIGLIKLCLEQKSKFDIFNIEK